MTECEPVLLASGADTETIREAKSNLQTLVESFFDAFPGEIGELLHNDDPCDLALDIFRIRSLVDEDGTVARVYREHREQNPLEYTTFGATDNLAEENQRLRQRQAEIEQKQYVLELKLKFYQSMMKNTMNLQSDPNSHLFGRVRNPSGFSVSKVSDFDSEEILDLLKDFDLLKDLDLQK
ncbi:MAG: hypothetical protein EAZ99_15035 [Alphaproteobacteria bacterium]|nr:MAG: hypothetical protein EAZ99_15035 [Alphaproteobacteria bacterium]